MAEYRVATDYARPNSPRSRKFGGAIPPRVFRPCVRVATDHPEGFEPEAHVVPSQRLHARAAPEYERRRISRPPHGGSDAILRQRCAQTVATRRHECLERHGLHLLKE